MKLSPRSHGMSCLIFILSFLCGSWPYFLNGQTIVGPGESLDINLSTAESFLLNQGTLVPRAVTLSGPIELQSLSTVRRPQNPLSGGRGGTETVLGPSLITGSISGMGGLLLVNQSTRDSISLSGNNSYLGQTFIVSGQVIAASSMALGSDVAGTIVQGGSLVVQVPTNEQFNVQGGDLRFTGTATAPNDPITIGGGVVYLPNVTLAQTPIITSGNGGELRATNNSTSWTGGSSGVGNLRLGGRIIAASPLLHQGDLTLGDTTLNVANNYTGVTIVTGESYVNHAGAFGQSTKVLMKGGYLTLNALPSEQIDYFVEDGELLFPDGAIVANNIILGGTPDASIRGNATYTGSIHVLRDNSLRNDVYGGNFNGQISGDGPLRLIGTTTADVHLNTANSFTGFAEARGGNVHVNHPDALPLAATNVDAGKLYLNVPTRGNAIVSEGFSNVGTLVFNAAQNYDETWIHHTGTMEATQEIGFERLIMLRGTNNLTRLTTSGAGAFRVDGELRSLREGVIQGKVTGTGTIRQLGANLGLEGDLSDFSGRFEVDRGRLFVTEWAKLGNSDIHVSQEGQLHINLTSGYPSGYVIENDIYLHNAHGGFNSTRSAFHYAGNSYVPLVFAGTLDVGNEGSTVSSTRSIAITGTIRGNNLTYRSGGLELRTAQSSLTGTLRLLDEAALNMYGGSLSGINKIAIEEGSTLYLYPNANTDRIADTVVVDSKGGYISLASNSTTPTSEHLGTLHLKQGSTRIAVSSDHGSLAAGLTIGQLNREQGSILRFLEAGNLNAARILGRIPEHGIIGPWAVTENGFATLDNTGKVRTLTPASLGNLNTAAPHQHVRVIGNHTLTGDLTVASLQVDSTGDPNTVNLNGHRLTVVSGGVFRNQQIINGEITAGTSEDTELIFHQSERVGANIVDNAGGGAVSVVVSSNSMRTSGTNSYTGGTWVIGSDYFSPTANAKLIVENRSAIPANDKVYLDNGTYEMQFSGGLVEFDEIHIRNRSLFTAGTATPIDVENLYLEDGRINAVLTGSGTITKRTDGTAEFTNSQASGFSGNVLVEEGHLFVTNNTLPQAAFSVSGGLLEVTGSSNFANNVTLDGGGISVARSTGTINVQSDSTMHHNLSTLFYGNIQGSGDLTILGTQTNPFSRYVGWFGNANEYSGNITLESGAFRVGSPSNAGSGIIRVEEAGRLILGSNHYSDPATNIDNDVHVYGGTLYSTPPLQTSGVGEASPSILAGSVTVHDEAFIGAIRPGFKEGVFLPGLTFAGELILTDNSRVCGLSDERHWKASYDVALVDVSGELVIGSNTTWNLLTSSLSISGAIRALNARICQFRRFVSSVGS